MLAELHVEPIADYDTYLAGEVAEADLDSFRQRAEDCGILYEVRRDFDLIQVNGYVFSSFGAPTALPEDMSIATYEGSVSLFLVQMKAPLTPAWHSALVGAGDIVSYLPENTFVVRATSDAAAALASLPGVQHVSVHQPAYKVRRSLLARAEPVAVNVQLDGGQNLQAAAAFLRTMTGQEPGVTGDNLFGYAQVKLAPAQLRAVARRPEVLWVEPALPIGFSGERQATIVAGCHNGVQPVRYPPDGHHDWLLDKGFCTPTEAPSGCMVYWTKVGVVDSGLDKTVCDSGYNPSTGECGHWQSTNVRHPDLDHVSNLPEACDGAQMGPEGPSDCDDPVIRDRFFCAGSLDGSQCDSGSWYDFSDYFKHGTSVMSMIAGDPLSHSDPEFDPGGYYSGTGLAPSAQIVVAKQVGTDQLYPDTGMRPQDYQALISQVYSLGYPWGPRVTRFAQNSWNLKDHNTADGTYHPEAYEYTLHSAMADQLVRDAYGSFDDYESDMTLVFSAGNDEYNHLSWAASPGNAKNVISVGASRGYSEYDDVTEEWDKAHAECIDEEHLIPDVAGGAGLTWHSRRGYINEPGGSGINPRFKPDLVAPGTQEAAARSRQTGGGYQCFYGTSAAAPAVTAAAVLAETWYYYKVTAPLFVSPAMIRALLVAHADSLAEGHDWHESQTLPHSPSLAQGWGRVNLDKLFHQDDVAEVVFDQDHRQPLPSDGRRFTASGQYWSVQLRIDDPARDIIVVLVYTDLYSTPPASSLTVNDLDLRVFRIGIGGPGTGRRYFGNYFEHPTSPWYSKNTDGQILPTLPEDPHNTVEVVRVYPGELTSTFWVRVSAKTLADNAVPGLDGGNLNQDFALYVYSATVEP